MGTMALAFFVGYMSFSYPAESAFFPRVLSVLLAGFGLLLFLRLVFKESRVRKRTPGGEGRKGLSVDSHSDTLKSAATVFASIVIYELAMNLVNYEAATILFLATMMPALGFRRPLWVAVLSVGLMLMLYGIFFELLGVVRPDSLWL